MRRSVRARFVKRVSSSPDDAASLTVGLANYGTTYAAGEWHRFVDLGRAAEDAGVDRIVVVDHVVMGPHTEKYVWGKFPVPPDAPWFEPLTCSRRSPRSRRGSGSRPASSSRRCGPPALLAKQAATLDVLSRRPARPRRRHRLAARGVRRRGARLRAARAAAHRHARGRARRCGATRRPRSTRRRSSFRDIYCEPKPLQPGGVPLWIGGHAAHAQPRPHGALRRRVDPDHGRDARRHRRRRKHGSRTRGRPRAAIPPRCRCRRRCGSSAATTAGPIVARSMASVPELRRGGRDRRARDAARVRRATRPTRPP